MDVREQVDLDARPDPKVIDDHCGELANEPVKGGHASCTQRRGCEFKRMCNCAI